MINGNKKKHKKDRGDRETTKCRCTSNSERTKSDFKDECNESNLHEEAKAGNKVEKGQNDERQEGRNHEESKESKETKETKSTIILPPDSNNTTCSFCDEKETTASESRFDQEIFHEVAISDKERRSSSSINSRASNMFDLNSEGCVYSAVDYPANKKTGPSYTRILDKFKDFSPKYEPLYQRDSGLKELRIWKVTLKNDKEYVLKSIRLKKNSRSLIQSIINEYHIGRTLGALSPNAIKTLDLQQKTLDNEEVVIEMLMEYGGVALTS